MFIALKSNGYRDKLFAFKTKPFQFSATPELLLLSSPNSLISFFFAYVQSSYRYPTFLYLTILSWLMLGIWLSHRQPLFSSLCFSLNIYITFCFCCPFSFPRCLTLLLPVIDQDRCCYLAFSTIYNLYLHFKSLISSKIFFSLFFERIFFQEFMCLRTSIILGERKKILFEKGVEIRVKISRE